MRRPLWTNKKLQSISFIFLFIFGIPEGLNWTLRSVSLTPLVFVLGPSCSFYVILVLVFFPLHILYNVLFSVSLQKSWKTQLNQSPTPKTVRWTSSLKSSKRSGLTQSCTQKAMALLFRTLLSAKTAASVRWNRHPSRAVRPGRASCAAATLGVFASTIWWRTGLGA